MTPAEQGVIRYALQRGFLQQAQLAQAQQEQQARAARAQPAELLPLLAAFLSPQQLGELRRVYLSFSSPSVNPQASGSTWPSQVHLQGSSELIQVTNLPDGGEQTIQLGTVNPSGITYAAPPGGSSGSFGPRGSVYLGAGAPAPLPPGIAGNTMRAPLPGQGSSAGFVQPVTGSSQGGGAGGPARLPEPGEVIGEYVLIRELARGGMGVVYDARHQTLDRRAALKLLLSQNLDGEDTAVKRFMVEAKELGRLSHPNIAAVFGAGRDVAGRHFMAMEFLDGEDLKDRIVRTGPLEPELAAELTLKLARALEHAHGLGVLHRDLKPSNVIVMPDGEPKLVDFGLARNLDAEAERLTKTGEIMGTPAYMPPEQAGGERHKVGPAADVYSLGATLFHMLTGRAPFAGSSVMNVINKVVSEEPPRPSSIREEIPPALEAICLKCLEKDIPERYGSASELATDLEAFLGPRGEVSAKQRGPLGRLLRWAQRKGAVVVGSLLALGGVAAAAAAVLAPGPAPLPSPSPSPSAPKASSAPAVDPRTRVSELVLDSQTFADFTGLQVRGGWGLRLDEGGIFLPSNHGMGPELSLPFMFRRDELDITVKAKVRYLSAGAGFRIELVQQREVDLNGRPGGPAILRVEFSSKQVDEFLEHGFRVNWQGAKGALRREEDADEFAFKELSAAGPFPLEFKLEIRPGQVALVWGKRRKEFAIAIPSGRPYRLDVRPGPNRYEEKPNTEDQAKPLPRLPGPRFAERIALVEPGMGAVVLEQLQLSSPGRDSVVRQEEPHQWAQLGVLEREAMGGEGLLALIGRVQRYAVPTGKMGVESNSHVRNEAVYLMGVLRALSGQREEAANGFNGLYGVNSVPPQAHPIQFQEWTAWLAEPVVIPFAEGYASYFEGALDAAGLEELGRKAHVDPERGADGLPPKKRRRPNPPLALNALVVAQARGRTIDPVLLGSAWFYSGNPERADALLAPQAEAGALEALGHAGAAAYVLRDFGRAAGYWRLLEERAPGSLQKGYAWAFKRAERLSRSK